MFPIADFLRVSRMKAMIFFTMALILGGCATQQPFNAAAADSTCRAKQLQPGSAEFAQCLAQQEPAPAKRHGIRYCRRGVFCQNL
jgi:hypothetical protein